MILKHPQNGSLTQKGIYTLLQTDGQQGKHMKTQFWQRWKSITYQTFDKRLSAEPDRKLLKLPIRGYVQATSAS